MTNSDRTTEALVHHHATASGHGAAVSSVEADHAAIRALLSEYLEGQLDAPQCKRIRDHLAGCASCRAMLRTLERTIEIARGLPARRLPEDARRRLLDRMTSAARGSAVGA